VVLGIVRAGSLVMGETRALHGNLMSSVFPTIQLAFPYFIASTFLFFLFPPLPPFSSHDYRHRHHRRRHRYCEKGIEKGKKKIRKTYTIASHWELTPILLIPVLIHSTVL